MPNSTFQETSLHFPHAKTNQLAFFFFFLNENTGLGDGNADKVLAV